MSRAAAAVDRIAVAVVALVLVALGTGAVAWQSGLIPGARDELAAPWARTTTDTAWWPWVLGLAGVVLMLIGLRWLAAHLPSRRVSDVRLPGSGSGGRLYVDLGAVASAAAGDLAGAHGVRSVRGRALADRGRRTIELGVTVDPTASLRSVREAVEATTARLAQSIGTDHAVRVRVHTARRTRGTTRVS